MALKIIDGPSHATLVEGQAKTPLEFTLKVDLERPEGRRTTDRIYCTVFHREILDFDSNTWGLVGMGIPPIPVPPQLFKATFMAACRKGVLEWIKPTFSRLDEHGSPVEEKEIG